MISRRGTWSGRAPEPSMEQLPGEPPPVVPFFQKVNPGFRDAILQART